MMISFRLNRKSDNELISLLSKYENNNMSEFIRGVLRGSLLTSKSISNDVVEDVFASDDVNESNTDNVNIDVEVRNINRKAEISNIENKSKVIKWNNPNLK